MSIISTPGLFKLIQRRHSDLERVGVLLFVPDAPHPGAPSNETGNNGLTPGYCG